METCKSINPFDQSIIEEFPLLTNADLEKKLEVAAQTFQVWRKESFFSRCDLMMKVASLLRMHKEHYALVVTSEMGKTIQEARNEVEKCAQLCEYYAQHAEKFLADEIIPTEATRSYVRYQPIGAVLAIMPWNFPLWQVFRFAVPALMAGNVGLLKHAPNVSRTSLTIENIFREAGFPEGVFQSLIIGIDKVECIIQHRIVQGVALTGSEYAGSHVAALAGQNIKKTVLELGGSDAFIVLDDADLMLAAKVGTQSRMQNAGQSCIAAKRFIVVKKIKDEFLHHFQQNIKVINQGDPLDANITMGPMARLDLAEKIEKQKNDSVALGARILVEGGREDCHVAPVLLDTVKPGMPAFDEETFGPLASVITVQNEQEAVTLANNNRYGLGSSLWTRDLDKADKLACEIEAGAVFVNSLVRSDARLPFGGIKKSGYGRELSIQGIREFVNLKTVFIEK